MVSAPAWVNMCQPSASRAMDPNTKPATISPTIMLAVSATTSQTRFSLRSCCLPRK
ncbi:MAG: hypothetical protein USCGTAYLOR_00936 [Chromatiales bacterium USCg_Taylor]|nr:MAG: hypothetical protein USCGTAYLOR_00936 [Chromatiales bacterium USCg_Taylor]